MFGTENITVILGWSEDKGALYDLVVLPQAFKIISSTVIVLTLQYNVLYNVSIALSLCGHISTDTLKLNYGKANNTNIIINYYNIFILDIVQSNAVILFYLMNL